MAKKNRIQNKKHSWLKVWFHRKKKVSKWNYVINDEYTLKARKPGYRARSVYKLL